MNFVISDGSQRNILVGDSIRLAPGSLPENIDGKPVVVTKVDSGYPYFNDGAQDSAISPCLIVEVVI